MGFNVIQDTSLCDISGDPTGNVTGLDPQLGPLQFNGGPTFPHALLTSSPAIDAGDNSNCLSEGQRGVARPQDGDGNGSAICDIGAFEVEAAPSADDDGNGVSNAADLCTAMARGGMLSLTSTTRRR